MITRHRIFSSNPRADLWQMAEIAAEQPPTSNDTTNATYAFFVALGMYRGRWVGTLLEWAFTALIWATEALFAALPLPVRVRWKTNDMHTAWRVRWLGWSFLWGLKYDAVPPTALPAEDILPAPPGPTP